MPPLSPLSPSSMPSALPQRFARRRLLLGFMAAAPFAPAAAAPAELRLNDHMTPFWPAYDAARALPPEQRGASLLARYFAPRRALYAMAGIPFPEPARIDRWLAGFDPTAEAVRQTHARFAGEFRRIAAGFRAACPDFDGAASPVYLLPSLGWFDGHLEPDGSTLPLFFGLDQIVRLHGPQADLGVLLSHEIFHCYQGQGNPDLFLAKTAPLYANLWGEGSAVYASERFNPSARLHDLLLHQDALLRDGPAVAPRVAAMLRERLDSTEPADAAPFFSLSTKGAQPDRPWPDMIGYYIGLLCARDIGRGMSLHDIAFLPAEPMRERLDAALARIAGTGAGR
jgi:hypothetical protein